MTAVLLGSYTLGDAIPGVKDALTETGDALNQMRGVANSALNQIGGVADTLDGIAGALNATKDDLLASPVQAFQDTVDGVQTVLNDLLSLSSPDLKLGQVVDGLKTAIDLLEALDPVEYFNDQVSALNSALDSAQSRLDSALGDIQDLTDISDALGGVTDTLRGIQGTIQSALNDTVDGVVAFTEQISEMLNSGVFVVSYTGPLDNLGSDVDGVLPQTGLGSSTQVAGPLLICKTADTATLSALNKAFGF